MLEQLCGGSGISKQAAQAAGTITIEIIGELVALSIKRGTQVRGDGRNELRVRDFLDDHGAITHEAGLHVSKIMGGMEALNHFVCLGSLG
jgi:hypothetical protein